MVTNNITWHHFLYISPLCWPKNRRFVHNFCLNSVNDFIFAPPPNITNINIAWSFYYNVIRWHHFMTSYIPPLLMEGVVPHFQVAIARAYAQHMWIIFLLKFSKWKSPHPHKGLRPNAAVSDQSDLVGFGRSSLWGEGRWFITMIYIVYFISAQIHRFRGFYNYT